MIKQETVLTATPIALERVPQSFKLYDRVNPIIQGLTNATLSVDGYSMDDIAVKLPKNTEGECEHTELMGGVVDRIAPIIRQSMTAISECVIPTCDRLEKALKSCSDRNKLIDYVFDYFRIEPTVIPRALMESMAFDVTPDSDMLNGMLYSFPDFPAITVPDLTAAEIRGLASQALVYPELVEVFNDDESVKCGYHAIFDAPYWLFQGDSKKVDVRRLEIEPANLNSLIVMNVLLYKLTADDEPLKDLMGIELEQYRRHLASLKRLVSTLMVLTKKRLNILISQGIVIDKRKVTYSVGKDDSYSSFNKAYVVSGNAGVFVSEEVLEFLSSSDKYSLTEVVLGMLLHEFTKAPFIPGNGVMDRIPGYAELTEKYYTSLGIVLSNNIKVTARNAINDAIIELASGPIWKEYLDGQDGLNNVSKLEKILAADSGYLEMLTSPTFISKVVSDNLRIANTVIAPRLANGLGAPIAAEILENNMHEDCTSQEKQRKILAKAIAKVVVCKLLK